MDVDRQAIERRDFPVSRRGYDPAAVDAHLRSLASEFEQLQRSAGAGESSLASTAGTQVQSIIEAAETAAAEIQSQAVEHARRVREAADRDAERTREQAIERARSHTAAVEQATAALLTRVESMDGEVGKLVEELRTGAGRLAGDLGALEQSMGELYDAAAGRSAPPNASSVPPVPSPANGDDAKPRAASAAPAAAAPTPQQPAASAPAQPPAAAQPLPIPENPAAAQPPAAPELPVQPTATGGDLDGARLIALNMALNGQSREDAERYLAAHFQSIDRGKLIDEVYAAIEG
ncbi:MAG TPA: DivIVA domain-containing protein [Solirubrobacteraceae bacterium]|nr:DivIVA domain-containing protein [Solirubrobacteraceae bacterium]